MVAVELSTEPMVGRAVSSLELSIFCWLLVDFDTFLVVFDIEPLVLVVVFDIEQQVVAFDIE